jgi:hypothetical protein
MKEFEGRYRPDFSHIPRGREQKDLSIVRIDMNKVMKTDWEDR